MTTTSFFEVEDLKPPQLIDFLIGFRVLEAQYRPADDASSIASLRLRLDGGFTVTLETIDGRLRASILRERPPGAAAHAGDEGTAAAFHRGPSGSRANSLELAADSEPRP